MNLLILNTGMSFSLIFFYLGYFFRFKNNKLHRIFNTTGVFFNLSTAVFLLAGKYLMGGVEVMGIYAIVPPLAVNIHRFFASVSLILMLVMAYTGMTRKKEIHRKLHLIFLILYTVIFISGLMIFRSR